MKVVYSGRAIADLELMASYYRTLANPNISQAVELRLHRVIGRIARYPDSAPRLAQRPQVRVAYVVRYPYNIFYRVSGETIEILHIRHTARRPWAGDE